MAVSVDIETHDDTLRGTITEDGKVRHTASVIGADRAARDELLAKMKVWAGENMPEQFGMAPRKHTTQGGDIPGAAPDAGPPPVPELPPMPASTIPVPPPEYEPIHFEYQPNEDELNTR